MKKICILVVALATGLAVHGAAFQWTFSGLVQEPDGAAVTTYKAYLIDASSYSYNAAKADIAAGDITFLSSATKILEDTTQQGGTAARVNKTGGTTQPGTSYTAYFVVLNNETNPTYAYISLKEMTAQGNEMTNTSFAFGNQSAGQWQAVPEPTSGLLMLVGLAGLALRRRRA